MSIKKVLKKIFLYLFLAVLAVVVASILATFLYRDQLINHFIREANKNINTPVHIEKIRVSSLSNFPKISLSFTDVYVEESFAGSTYPLLQAKKIDFTFNPLDVWKGDYTIEEVHIKEGKCHIKINEQGTVNYDIIKAPVSSSGQTVKFDLSKITLDEVVFTYSNDFKNVYLDVFSSNTVANLSVEGSLYDIQTDGQMLLNYLLVNNATWAKDKSLAIQSNLNYDDQEKDITFHATTVGIKDSEFIVFGNYRFKEDPFIDLMIEGSKTDLQTLLSILPEKSTENFRKYESRGDVYFDLSLKGELGAQESPSLRINFGLIDAELSHPERHVKISHADLEGTLIAPHINDLSAATLTLKNVKGELEKRSFTGNLYIQNMDEPFLKCEFNGSMDMNSLFKFFPSKHISSGEGLVMGDIKFAGHLKDLELKAGTQKIHTSGEIDLKKVSLHFSDYPLPLKNLNGNLLFNNNDLALSNVSGQLGNSDFLLNGFFKNIIGYLLFENQPVGIESDLRSEFIDLDELLAANPAEASRNHEYSFQISPRLVLSFDCDIEHLKFRRFSPSNIRGDLKVKNQIALSEGIKFDAMGGEITLDAIIDASRAGLVKLNTNFNLEHINIDSIFYVFENFNQSFLEDRHLKGRIYADVNAEMIFNEELRLFPETLTSHISTSIKGGQLNNFEPMQQLTRYLDEDELDHLRFSELKNSIYINEKVIYLPEMEISSNVTTIKVSGTHSFDQKINYQVVAPLRSQRKIDKDEAFGAIEQDNTGRTKLYLKIVGNTSDYRIVYDKERVKQKVISDLKKEVNELKEAFKNKGKESNVIELQEGDYFDWE